MAKSLRSSRVKANNSNLRSDVFGPAEDARKERLSAKLLDLASQPSLKPKRDDDVPMIDEDKGKRCSETCLDMAIDRRQRVQDSRSTMSPRWKRSQTKKVRPLGYHLPLDCL